MCYGLSDDGYYRQTSLYYLNLDECHLLISFEFDSDIYAVMFAVVGMALLSLDLGLQNTPKF